MPVRTGRRTMTPTPHALALRAQVHEPVQQAQAVPAPERQLDLATLEGVFTVTCHDALTTAMAPALLAAIQAQAPRCGSGSSPRPAPTPRTCGAGGRPGDRQRRAGSCGGALRDGGARRPGRHCQPRPRPRRRGAHGAAIGTGAACHGVAPRPAPGPVDDALAALGLARQGVASAPTSTTALSVVRGGTFVVTAPVRICQPIIAALGLRTRPFPSHAPPVPIVCAWHQCYEDDRAHSWLRQQVHAVLREVGGAHDDAGRQTIATVG